MKVSLKTLTIYFMILLYEIIFSMIFINKNISLYSNVINPLVWLAFFLISKFAYHYRILGARDKIDKNETIFIVMLCYIILYFLSGLIFGYARSPYSHTFLGLVKNFWAYFIPIVFIENIRYVLLGHSHNSKIFMVMVFVLFCLIEINFYHFSSNFISGETGFKYIFQTIVPIISRNMLFNYFCFNAGRYSSLVFRLPIIFVNLITPIFPDYSWFVESLTGMSLCFVCYGVIRYKINVENKVDKEKNYKRKFQISNLLYLLSLLLFAAFVGGFFKYSPVAIMSNSMLNVFGRGDVVVIEKLDDEEKDELKLYDVIEYQKDNTYVVHRIVKIQKLSDGTLAYTTKGDNNTSEDFDPVYKNQIVAKVNFKIKYIGYPIVFLNEFFNNTTPTVDTGN